MLVAIDFPVIRIPLKHHALTGKILLQPERTESSDCIERDIQVPGFSEPSLLVRLLQQMFWKDRQGIKDPFGRSIGLSQIKPYGVCVQLCHRERLAVDHQEVALGRVNLVVQVHFESKDYVVGIEWLSVGEAQAFAEFQNKAAAVLRYLPGTGQRRFGLLRDAVDMYQIRCHTA